MNTSWTENTGIFNVGFKYTHNNLGNCLVENPAADVSTTGYVALGLPLCREPCLIRHHFSKISLNVSGDPENFIL